MKEACRFCINQLILFAGLLWPTTALAHAPIEGLGKFYGHFLHPVLVPEYALLVLAIALLLGQNGQQAARAGLAAMAMGLGIGLVLLWQRPDLGTGQSPILVGAMTAGAALSLDRRLHWGIPAGLALASGVVLGLDPEIAGLVGRDAVLAASGLVCGAVFYPTIIAGSTTENPAPWLRVGRRIVGAWITAAALLVLALAARSPG